MPSLLEENLPRLIPRCEIFYVHLVEIKLPVRYLSCYIKLFYVLPKTLKSIAKKVFQLCATIEFARVSSLKLQNQYKYDLSFFKLYTSKCGSEKATQTFHKFKRLTQSCQNVEDKARVSLNQSIISKLIIKLLWRTLNR